MFETLDIMISIAIIFLILSMVLKYWLSVIKRATKIKARVISEEVKNFVGENTSKYLIPYLEKHAKHLNFLDDRKRLGKGKVIREKDLRQLSMEQLKDVAQDLKIFLHGKSAKDIQEKLGLDIPIQEIEDNIDGIREHLKNLKNRVEANYDNTMEKISEIYEKRLCKRVFLWGIVFAVLINANFFQIYDSLAKNSLIREALVSKAETINNRMETLSREIEKKEGEAVKDLSDFFKKDIYRDMSALNRELVKTELSLGWNWKKIENFGLKLTEWESVPSFFKTLLGFLISGLLISFGAPFWHDFLSTFTGIKKKLGG
jgi:hypothetical protein